MAQTKGVSCNWVNYPTKQLTPKSDNYYFDK